MEKDITRKVREFLAEHPDQKVTFQNVMGVDPSTVNRWLKVRSIRGIYAQRAEAYLQAFNGKAALSKQTKAAIAESFIAHAKGLQTLGKHILSNEFTPMERQHLRDAIGGFGLVPLITLLNQLSGEHAREHFKESHNE